MSSAPPNQTPVAVDAALYFPPFSLLYKDLENLPLSPHPPPLDERLKESRAWFLDTVYCFKSQNVKSKEAVEKEKFAVGTREFAVKPEIRELALKLSSAVCLDEVQSYIIVERSIQRSFGLGGINQGSLQEMLLQYYIERQCLLKCTRLLISDALYVGSDVTAEKETTVRNEALRLISQGFESKLISSLEGLLSSSHPQQMDVDLFILWAEETLIEVNFVLDILFLLYYESFCTCSAATWKSLCLLYKGMMSGSFDLAKLRASDEAVKYIYQAKVQMLFILMETLDFENLLQMIQNAIPFREGSKYTLSSIQEMDAVVSSFDVFEMKEAGPLVLAWAVFLCLILSLPEKDDNLKTMEIDHASYVRLSFEVESLSYFLEVIRSDVIKGSDGPTAGYKSILRTFISSFIASYEISIQPEDSTLKSILILLEEIYRGEEALCIQFWDRDSVIDGPIRCLLCSLEGEFPYRTIELISLLSALSEGSWPAECVYNFLDKSVGVSSLLEINNSTLIDEDSQTVLTNIPIAVPGVEGLTIPSNTRGHVLRMFGGGTALVQWEHTESGLFLLILRLAQNLDLYNSEEVIVLLDLLSRLVSFNMGVRHAIMNLKSSLDHLAPSDYEQTQSEIQIDVVEILSNVVRNLSFGCSNISAVAMGVNILTRMLKCSPSRVSMMVMKADLFDLSPKTSTIGVSTYHISSSSLLTGKLVRMLLIDAEQNMFCPFTISVLDFATGLIEAGVEDDFVLAIIVFCLQYVLVNHEYWKYRLKENRWLVTLKVLGVLKMSIVSIPYLTKFGGIIENIVLSDSSIHNTLFRIVCISSESLERLYFSRLHNLREIEGLHGAICSVLDILLVIHSMLWKDDFADVPILYQEILSSATKPIPVVTALTSLLAYIQSPAIQVGAARVLSMMLTIADHSRQILSANTIFGLGHKQVLHLRHSIESIILEKSMGDGDLFIATVKLLTDAAHFQPAFLCAIFAGDATTDLQITGSNVKDLSGEISLGPLTSKNSGILVDMVLTSLERSETLISSYPQALASVLDFLKALWQQAAQYADILKAMTKSKKFWEKLSWCILTISDVKVPSSSNLSEAEVRSITYKYRCQSTAFDIFSLALFLHKKLLHAEILAKQASQSSSGSIGGLIDSQKLESLNLLHLKDILFSLFNSSDFNKLVKLASCTVYDVDIHHHAKVASSVFSTHVIDKILSGDAGSLSATFIDKLRALFNELTDIPAFSDLFFQYSRHGYSGGTELRKLIISDLYYHLEGELVGRGIEPGPFRELSQFLVDSNIFQKYEKNDDDFLLDGNDVSVFDLGRLRQDIGLDMWDYSEWKASKTIAESLLLHLQNVNSMMLLLASRITTLKALILVLSLNESMDERITSSRKTRVDIISSCIADVCQECRAMVGLILATSDAPLAAVGFLAAQAELFLCLLRNMHGQMSLPIFKLLSECCSYGLKSLSESNSSSGKIKLTMKFLLIVQLLAVENILNRGFVVGSSDIESAEAFGEVSNTCLVILPVLCSCSITPDQRILSLTTIDLIMRRCLVPSTWFPIIQEHLQMQHIIMSLQDQKYSESISEILKFLLTLARVRGGAEMVLASGFLSSLKVMFADIFDDTFFPTGPFGKAPSDSNVEKPCYIWGLGVAILTAIICSLGGSPHVIDVFDSVVPFFFSEKAHLISYHLSAPDFPSDPRGNSRAWFQKRPTSLSGLRETEHTLMLICVLANHKNYWTKAMKGVESELRERSIHLLALISKGNDSIGESPTQIVPLLCPPINKEEIDCCKEPAFVNIKTGWFALTPLGCSQHVDLSSYSIKSTAIVIKDLSIRRVNSESATYFSDTVAVQIYRTAFLLLKFLCLQADNAARKAEELGFVDLSHFPELPMPDILHGLQDQAISIVSEICGANKSEQMADEKQGLCLLLLEVTEMSLYLELCVLQICGIRPVLGRVEDFSKEIKSFLRATEAHTFLKPSIKDLKQIISAVYPGVL